MRSKTKFSPVDHRDTGLSTRRMAAAFDVAEQTPRASLCRHGHWMGLIPLKLPSGRLLWSAAEVERLLSGKAISEGLAKGKQLDAIEDDAVAEVEHSNPSEDQQPRMEGMERVEGKSAENRARPPLRQEREEEHGR